MWESGSDSGGVALNNGSISFLLGDAGAKRETSLNPPFLLCKIWDPRLPLWVAPREEIESHNKREHLSHHAYSRRGR